ncbi:MAG: hypothetical protein AAGF33_19035 [Pseudomonadota bacterium]
MCLSVYIGCEHQFEGLTHSKGSLGLEVASWCPPPLSKFSYVYYAGRKGADDKLECSCMLLDHVVWDSSVPHIEADPLYPDHGECPFITLRGFVETASSGGRPVALLCDDSGGVDQACETSDYDYGVITLDMIRRDNFLFADPNAEFPWRVYHLVSGRR